MNEIAVPGHNIRFNEELEPIVGGSFVLPSFGPAPESPPALGKGPLVEPEGQPDAIGDRPPSGPPERDRGGESRARRREEPADQRRDRVEGDGILGPLL